MASRQRLTGADVDALFAGRSVDLPAGSNPAPRQRPYRPAYDACMCCGIITPGLRTFTGDTDWSPDVPMGGEVRRIITVIRNMRGVRNVLLCDECSTEPVTNDGKARA